MAEPPRSLSPAQQAQFAQEKLRQIYLDTCVWLAPHKDFLFLVQDIILWRKVAISAAIYCLVEIFFWHLYTSSNTYTTVVADIVFWLLLADGFWIVATRHKRGSNGDNKSSSSFISKLRRRQKELRYMSLEDAIIRDAKSLEIGESAPYEVMCLWIAKVIMLVDNVQLALRHWSQEQPYLFSVITGTFGLVCVVVGYFCSGSFLLFLLTNYFLLLPVFRYYNLLDRMQTFVNTHYPVLAQKLIGYYKYVKSLLSPLGEQEFVGIHLDPSQPMKDDLPETPSNQTDGSNKSDDGGATAATAGTTAAPPQPLRNRAATMTLTPFEQDPMDSLAPYIAPSEGFPSITAFFNEDSISLPSFPNPHQTRLGGNQWQKGGVSRQGEMRARPRLDQTHQDSLSLDPFSMQGDPLHDSFDEDFNSLKPIDEYPLPVVPSAPSPTDHLITERSPPNEPPPPYEFSPLVTSTKASTPASNYEDPPFGLRQREKK